MLTAIAYAQPYGYTTPDYSFGEIVFILGVTLIIFACAGLIDLIGYLIKKFKRRD